MKKEISYFEIAKNAVNESTESDKLSKEINKSILKIDDSMSYVDFAHAVAKVLKDEYGKHNYIPFIN